MFTLSFLL
jgi:hypothetical protein